MRLSLMAVFAGFAGLSAMVVIGIKVTHQPSSEAMAHGRIVTNVDTLGSVSSHNDGSPAVNESGLYRTLVGTENAEASTSPSPPERVGGRQIEEPKLSDPTNDPVVHLYADDPSFNPERKIPGKADAARLLQLVNEWESRTAKIRSVFDQQARVILMSKLDHGDRDVFEPSSEYNKALAGGYQLFTSDKRFQQVRVVMRGSSVYVVRVNLGESQNLDGLWVQVDSHRQDLYDRIRGFFSRL